MERATHPVGILDPRCPLGLPTERPLWLHVVAESGAIRLAKRLRGRIHMQPSALAATSSSSLPERGLVIVTRWAANPNNIIDRVLAALQ